ncbi:zf-DHHC-domain-containing protein [Athelia psychrophila]|uniref:Palmitoyltransferase n=1 Tax=Athelia psychrophila TaxID=1759441 RepID=A0A166BDY7_9AGAM|nr:zf-DHHC-domain-containing protein [Fibularhizoctonia sp. CBS 109695]
MPASPVPSPAPNVTTFQQATHNPTNSTTHAGGILPSTNFFRPLRAFQRPATAESAEDSNGLPIMAPDPGLFQLAPLEPRRSTSSENLSGSTHGPESAGAHGNFEIKNLDDEEMRRQFSAPTRMKHSREPLLPIGGRPSISVKTNNPPVPPMAFSRGSPATTQSNKSPTSPAPNGPAARVKNNIGRALKRGFSFDSRRSNASSPSEPQRTFEGKAATPAPADDIFADSHQRKPSTPFAHDLNQSTPQLPPSPSPDHSFVSTPPAGHPPLSAMPVVGPNGRVQRKYEAYPSRNRFYGRGRFLTGGDSPWAFVASFGLTLGITGTWFGTTAVWWWHNESPAVACVVAYMCLLTISCMLTTAFRDPGILPRNLDPDPPYPSTSPSDGSRAPLPRDLKMRQDTVRVKYCSTCKTYRPPRSSHCKMCDNCVDACDHHCQWVNNCVGRRNYTSFFIFLSAAVTTILLFIITSALHIYYLTQREHLDFQGALVHGIGSTIVFCLSVIVIWPVTALLSYHMRLLLLNVTTIEQIRNSAHKTLVPGASPPNPFSHGTWRRNLGEVLCRPAGFSWLDGRGVKTEDRRELNPGWRDLERDLERGLGPGDWDP